MRVLVCPIPVYPAGQSGWPRGFSPSPPTQEKNLGHHPGKPPAWRGYDAILGGLLGQPKAPPAGMSAILRRPSTEGGRGVRHLGFTRIPTTVGVGAKGIDLVKGGQRHPGRLCLQPRPSLRPC